MVENEPREEQFEYVVNPDGRVNITSADRSESFSVPEDEALRLIKSGLYDPMSVKEAMDYTMAEGEEKRREMIGGVGPAVAKGVMSGFTGGGFDLYATRSPLAKYQAEKMLERAKAELETAKKGELTEDEQERLDNLREAMQEGGLKGKALLKEIFAAQDQMLAQKAKPDFIQTLESNVQSAEGQIKMIDETDEQIRKNLARVEEESPIAHGVGYVGGLVASMGRSAPLGLAARGGTALAGRLLPKVAGAGWRARQATKIKQAYDVGMAGGRAGMTARLGKAATEAGKRSLGTSRAAERIAAATKLERGAEWLGGRMGEGFVIGSGGEVSRQAVHEKEMDLGKITEAGLLGMAINVPLSLAGEGVLKLGKKGYAALLKKAGAPDAPIRRALNANVRANERLAKQADDLAEIAGQRAVNAKVASQQADDIAQNVMREADDLKHDLRLAQADPAYDQTAMVQQVIRAENMELRAYDLSRRADGLRSKAASMADDAAKAAERTRHAEQMAAKAASDVEKADAIIFQKAAKLFQKSALFGGAGVAGGHIAAGTGSIEGLIWGGAAYGAAHAMSAVLKSKLGMKAASKLTGVTGEILKGGVRPLVKAPQVPLIRMAMSDAENIAEEMEYIDPDALRQTAFEVAMEAGMDVQAASAWADAEVGRISIIKHAATPTPAGKIDRVKLVHAIQAAQDPRTMVTRIRNGSLTIEDVMLLQLSMPETARELKRQAEEVLDNPKLNRQLDAKTRRTLMLLAGRRTAPLARTILQAEQEKQQQPPKGGSMKPPQAATQGQRVASGLGK